MADTLEIYGIEFPNSTGIKATDNNGVVQTYIKPQGTKSITANGTGIDVAEYASVNVNVSGAFVVTATFTNNEWSMLDKTFAQIQSAYSQGLTIEVSAFDTYAYMQCGTWCEYSNEEDMFVYSVSWFDYQDTGYQFVDTYIMTSTETVLDDRQEYGAPTTLVQKTITANGTYNPILTDYADGYSLVTVNVPQPTGTKIINITSNGTTTEDVTNYANAQIGVNVSSTTINPLSVTQNGTYTAPSGTAYSPVTVSVSGGGGGQTGKDVVFLDYDGTEVASYDIADLTALPSNPSHTGLIAQGWNWTLQQITAQHTAYPDQTIYVGQMYTTDTGDTRLYIHIDDDTPSNRMTFYVRFTSSTANNVTIDWGDGVTETKGSTTATNYPHTYTTGGDYVIKLTVNSGTISFVGSSGTSGNSIYGSRANANTHNRGRIRKAEIGNNVTSIGNYAFYYCYSITNITIPIGVTTIGTYVFQNCHALTSITIPSNVTIIETYAFYSCYSLKNIAIPSGVTNISSYCFQYCHVLVGITIPSGVIGINEYAFASCYSLTSITIPNNVAVIANSVFSGCPITEITIPNGATQINAAAFSGCNSLTRITIPNTITKIDNYAFQSCYSLKEISIPNTVTTMGTYVFSGCRYIKSVTIPQNVTVIQGYMFQNCYTLNSVTLSGNITSIGSNSFYNCYSLNEITLPNTVTNIYGSAFYGCYSLTEITIPSSVTSIGVQAFNQCYGIGEYHFEPTTPPTITNTNVFSGIASDCKIYVPYSADHSILESYQTANYWSTYASYMVEESA